MHATLLEYLESSSELEAERNRYRLAKYLCCWKGGWNETYLEALVDGDVLDHRFKEMWEGGCERECRDGDRVVEERRSREHRKCCHERE